MSSVVTESPCALAPSVGVSADQQIRQRVQRVLRQHRYQRVGRDRRHDHREPFPYPIHVTPLSQEGCPLSDATIVVLGKHLSERGLDFYCEAPLPYRRVIVSWESGDGGWLALLLDLRWCRSTKYGWYENGGRFLRVVPSPLNSADAAAPAGADEPSVEP